MSPYLLPNDHGLTIAEKQLLFSIKNKMLNIHGNFSSKQLEKYCKGGCDIIKSKKHIYDCEKWNRTKNITKYEEIYNGTLLKQVEVFHTMKENLIRRESFPERSQ